MNRSRKIIRIAALLFLLFTSLLTIAQKTNPIYAKDYRVLTTAVPFLTIAPDSRAGAMGELGAATEPDLWSMHWNPSKYSFEKKDFGIGLSYTPWLRNLQIKDVNQVYLAGFKKLDKMQTIGFSFLYFNLGNIDFTNSDGIETGQHFYPREFSLDGAYSRLLSKDFSFAISLRYINSDLVGHAQLNPGENAHAAQTVASDISGYYQKSKNFGGIPTELRFGFNISNLGGQIQYASGSKKDYLPATLRIAGGSTFKLDEFNDLGVNLEASKLLVPTPMKLDSAGNVYGFDTKNNTASVPTTIIHSFYDAPGGMLEEWHEVMWAAGLEYWYVKQFALRAGYFYENQSKGNRKFFTFGLGLKMSVMGFDAAYIVPSGGSNSPIANTWRISLTFDFDKAKPSASQTEQKKNM
jgi:hypothetical protein